MLSIYDPAFWFDLVSAVGSIATAWALFYLWRQYKQTQQQMVSTQQERDVMVRPWIGMSEVIINFPVITVHIKNYGQTPGKIVTKRKLFDKTKIIKEQLRSTSAESSELMLFPDATHYLSSILPQPEKGQHGYKDQYIGFMIEYEYAHNKRGEFSLIVKQIAGTGTVSYEEIFAQ